MTARETALKIADYAVPTTTPCIIDEDGYLGAVRGRIIEAVEKALTAARADERAKVKEEIERAEEIGVLRTAHHAGKALAEKDEEIDSLRARLAEAEKNYTRSEDDRNEVVRGRVKLRDSLEAAESRVRELEKVLGEMTEAVTQEVNEKGGGGFVLARLSDARAALKEGSVDETDGQ